MTDARGKDIAVKPLGPEFMAAVVVRPQSIKRHFVSNVVSLPSLEMLVCSLPFVYTGFGEGGRLLLTLLVLNRMPFEFNTHQSKYYVIKKEDCGECC